MTWFACLMRKASIRMSVPAGQSPISSVVSQRIPEVLRSGQVTFQDFTGTSMTSKSI